MQEEQKHQDEKKTNSENLWDTTLKTFHNVTSQATRYTRLAQRRIDLSLLPKKIANAHSELGKVIDESRNSEGTDIFEQIEVKAALQNLDNLKLDATRLNEEIENLKNAAFVETSDTPDSTKQ